MHIMYTRVFTRKTLHIYARGVHRQIHFGSLTHIIQVEIVTFWVCYRKTLIYIYISSITWNQHERTTDLDMKKISFQENKAYVPCMYIRVQVRVYTYICIGACIYIYIFTTYMVMQQSSHIPAGRSQIKDRGSVFKKRHLA